MPQTGGLAPLNGTLIPQSAALATELRTLFSGLDVSITRYAARVHMDKSVVSRYLSGERIPRWEFVHQLLVESALVRDRVPPTQEVIAHLQSLHRAALEAGGAPGHLVQLLQEQLAQADAYARRTETREQELELALQEARHRVAELEIRYRELEATNDRQRDEVGAELETFRRHINADRERLLAEVDRLTRDLEEAHKRRIAAEERCIELEHRLEQIPDEPDLWYHELLREAESARDRASRLEEELRQAVYRKADTGSGTGAGPTVWETAELDRADTEHRFALALQSGMLPRTLVFGAGIRGAWRYEATTTGVHVGGDWYDSMALDDGSTMLIVGDVEGHNVHAAGMMYRLRTIIRAHAAQGYQVDQILQRAHDFVVELSEETSYPLFATCLMVRVDPDRRMIATSRAGHIPPIIVPPDKPAHVAHANVDLPLGVAEFGHFTVWQTTYEPGTRLVLCTDGLLVGIGNDVDQGLARTIACVNDHHDFDIETMADALLDWNRPRSPWKDDVAVLLAELS